MYMSLDKNNRPNGWNEKQLTPDYIEVSEAVCEQSKANPDLRWDRVLKQLYVYQQPEQPAHIDTPEEIREALKLQREIAVSQIKVTTTTGNTFDGDETSQGRMSRAAAALKVLTDNLAAGTPITLPPEAEPIYRIVNGEYETIWVLADNSPVFVSANELLEALALAGAAQAAIWVIA